MGNTYLSDSAKILVKMKRFQKAINKIRKKWGVPENGFKYEDRAKGHGRIYWTGERNDRHYAYYDYQEDLIPPTKQVRLALRKLSKEFNLDFRWHFDLYFYILGSDKLDPPASGVNLDVRFNDTRLPEEQWVVTKLSLDIYQDSTIEDIKAKWRQIEKYQSMMPAYSPQRKRVSGNIERYIKVRDLEDEGKSHKEIAEIAELGFSSDPKAVSYLKNELEKRFSPKKFKKIRYFPYD